MAHQWRIIKTHDLSVLVAEVVMINASFSKLKPFADLLTVHFFAQHYPGFQVTGLDQDYPVIPKQLDELVALIKAELPRYFPS